MRRLKIRKVTTADNIVAAAIPPIIPPTSAPLLTPDFPEGEKYTGTLKRSIRIKQIIGYATLVSKLLSTGD